MARVKGGVTTRKRRKKWLKLAKGYYGHKHIAYKTAKEQVMNSLAYAYRDRRNRKRNFRKLWIARINAATRAQGLSYSVFINGLKNLNINLNRKMLSELAIHNPNEFSNLVQLVQKAKNKPTTTKKA